MDTGVGLPQGDTAEGWAARSEFQGVPDSRPGSGLLRFGPHERDPAEDDEERKDPEAEVSYSS